MNIVGIISEYNPFHNGHLHQITEIKKLFKNNIKVICLLSSDFVQRGEPALLDKYARAQMAISNGADMVLEYPTLFCCASAESYADNAVYILNNIGIIDYISYGFKSSDNDNVKKISSLLAYESNEYKEILKAELSKGLSFPKARQHALIKLLNKSDTDIYKLSETLKSSNDILAIEYEKALIRQKSDILTVPIERTGSDYNDPYMKENFSSATAIRKYLLSEKVINNKDLADNLPPSTLKILEDYSEVKHFGSMYLFENLIFYSVISKSNDELKKYPLVNEGIENLLKKNVFSCSSVNDFINTCVNKRYPATRIQRLLIHILLGMNKGITYKYKRPGYIRVLACRNKSLLSLISSKSSLPVITSLKKSYDDFDSDLKTLIEFENKACDIYNIVCLKDKSQYLNEFSVKPMFD